MAYLRFSRDKHGYENIFVLHPEADAASKPRLLYWFRTPANVGVGRVPLDEETMRAIEEHNPDVSFDWDRMLKDRPVSTPDVRTSGNGKGRSGPRRAKRTGERTGETRRGTRALLDIAGLSEVPPVSPEEPTLAGADRRHPADRGRAGEAGKPVATRETVTPVGRDSQSGRVDAPARPNDEHPVVTLMGTGALARFRARHAEILQRIVAAGGDAHATDTLQARAARLDPDGWKSIPEAVAGIECFDREVSAIDAELARARSVS